jgi:hypothetical protein
VPSAQVLGRLSLTTSRGVAPTYKGGTCAAPLHLAAAASPALLHTTATRTNTRILRLFVALSQGGR